MSNQIYTVIKPGYTTTISKSDFLATIPSSLRISPDEVKVSLDPSQDLVNNDDDHFVVSVTGDGMIGSGIHDSDQLIIDRNVSVQNGSIVVVVIRGLFTLRRVKSECSRTWLVAENDKYRPIEVTKHCEAEIWGVVTNIIHPVL